MTTQEKTAVYDQYGNPQTFIDQLRDLAEADDLRSSDISEALRDINFIRSEAGDPPLNEFDILEALA